MVRRDLGVSFTRSSDGQPRGGREWTAWQHDRALAVQHTGAVTARWVEQWPDPEALAAEAARLWPSIAEKAASDDRAERTALAAAILAWLWGRVRSADATLDALTKAVRAARALGRDAALHAITSIGLTIPAGTQALDAFEAADAATSTANAAGTLNTSIRARLARIAAVLAAAILKGVTVTALAALIAALVRDVAWLTLLIVTEIWKAINAAAATVYAWAAVGWGHWQTADDDRVCAVCSGNEDLGVVTLDALPDCPGHPRCRCVILPDRAPASAIPGVQLADLAAA